MPRNQGSGQRPSLRRFTISLPLLFAVVVVVSMFLMGAMLSWQGWQVARSALLMSAQEHSLSLGRLVDEKAQNMLSSATSTLHQLSRDPIVGADNLPDRLARAEIFANTLLNVPVVAAVYVGYANGEFLLLRPLRGAKDEEMFDPPDGAAYMMQTVTRDGHGDLVGEWRFFDPQMRILNMRPMPDYHFDPRERPWYTDAQAHPGVRLTEPYLFFTTRQVGVTISEKPKFESAVVALDVELSDLNAQMRQLRPTPRTEIAVAKADGTLIAYTDANEITVSRSGGLKLQTLAGLDKPVLADLSRHSGPPRQTLSLDSGGEKWFGIRIPLSAVRGNALDLYIATPDSDLLQATRSGLARQTMGAGVFTLALMMFGWFAGRRLGRDLTDLTARAHQLSQFDFRPR